MSTFFRYDAIGFAGGNEAYKDGGGLAAAFSADEQEIASSRRIARSAGYSECFSDG